MSLQPQIIQDEGAVTVKGTRHHTKEVIVSHNGEAPTRPNPNNTSPTFNKHREVTLDFLDLLRREETQENEARKIAKKKRCMSMKFSKVIETAETELNTAEEGLEVLYNANSISIPGVGEDMASTEQHMEETLAMASVQVASLVVCNYPDKFDYIAATEPIIDLTKLVKNIIDDGSVISSSLYENARKPFIDDLRGLCEATKEICEAAKSNKKMLNDAAIKFRDRSAKLLGVVSTDVDPNFETEVISQAKAISETTSRLALEASNVASSTSSSYKQDICTASENCVDAAGKLVYTAKLVTPTIHHSTCQDALLSSADSLSSSLTTFSDTWKALSSKGFKIQKLTEYVKNLEALVEKLRNDVKARKLEERVPVDTLFREMAACYSKPVIMEIKDSSRTANSAVEPLYQAQSYCASEDLSAADAKEDKVEPTHLAYLMDEADQTLEPRVQMLMRDEVSIKSTTRPAARELEPLCQAQVYSAMESSSEPVPEESNIEKTHLEVLMGEVDKTTRPQYACKKTSQYVSMLDCTASPASDCPPEPLSEERVIIAQRACNEDAPLESKIENTYLENLIDETDRTIYPQYAMCQRDPLVVQLIEVDVTPKFNNTNEQDVENQLQQRKYSGQSDEPLEVSTEDPDKQKRNVQEQFDRASKWLLKLTTKADVKANGQQAVRNIIQNASKVADDLKEHDREELRQLIMETEELLTECSKKYDHKQYSVLMERVQELKKAIERGVVTSVVENFMEAEAPLVDLDILADHERGAIKHKFLLEKKIAELIAHLSRITKTARLIADTETGSTIDTELNIYIEQAELLASQLVKAQQKVPSLDDKMVINNYKSLLAEYSELLSNIRPLCDQSVDPVHFVQTAGKRIRRMRKESMNDNDPKKCDETFNAIAKLGYRVIPVGMSSSTARRDPELQNALLEIQQQLTAATSLAGTCRMSDWKHTTAQILKITEEVESLLCGEAIFKKQPEPNQPIYNEAWNLHSAIRDWSAHDNEIIAVAKRMAVLMARLSNYMKNADNQREVLATSKSIMMESHEVTRLAKKLAHECTDRRIKSNILQACERIPTVSGQLKMLITVKASSFGRHGIREDNDAMDMLVGNAQSLMLSIQHVVKGAVSASVKIMSQRGLGIKCVRKSSC